MKKCLYILFFFALAHLANATHFDKDKNAIKTISGKLTDTYGEPIAGAKITVAETGETFFADLDGNFKLNIKTDKEYAIIFNTIGFEPLQIKSTHLSPFAELSLKSL